MNDWRAAFSGANRRDFLKSGAAVAAGAYAMRWGLGHAAEVPREFDGSKFQLAAAEPNPKRGGVLRVGMPLRAPHFDLHQSGTIFNLGSMACMFDTLIRHDPRDSGKTIIPDLAHSWEIAKDAMTYTFHLRQGVQFHDGAELTAEDVKATFDRIAKPPSGISIPRSILFKAVSEITAPDKHTVQFKLAEPRPVNFIMSAIASGWNVIVRKKTPLDDPRVRRAMHLVLDKPVLVDVVKDVAPMMVGGFIYPFSEFATPKEELAKRVGYQTDQTAAVKEARALMAAAGHPNGIKGLDYMVREIATFKLWSQAIQAMLKEALNIECNIRTAVESVWFGDATSGNFDLAIGAIVSTLLDPSDYFNAWYGKNGPQNYSFWDNKEFQALTAQIDSEMESEKRPGLIRKAENHK